MDRKRLNGTIGLFTFKEEEGGEANTETEECMEMEEAMANTETERKKERKKRYINVFEREKERGLYCVVSF